MFTPNNIQKSFNVTGPCLSDKHYMVDPLERLPQALDLTKEDYYFAIHAPNYSGKTTLLRHLASKINAEGNFYAMCPKSVTGVGPSLPWWPRGCRDDEKMHLDSKKYIF
ncbi:MAG: hypothetical protein LBR22_04495 [Desulfovibrio sp.]|jgi:hypothetical protein|nr:hypothetical protein [Desulfovibrio sp.]